MRQKEISLNIRPLKPVDDDFADDHVGHSAGYTTSGGCFDLDDDQKIEKIEKHFREIMTIFGLDLTDDSLNGTPHRVAKMYVKEVFSGLNPKNRPTCAIVREQIQLRSDAGRKGYYLLFTLRASLCSYLWQSPCGLFFQWKGNWSFQDQPDCSIFSKRPQVQERLTVQIGKEMQRVLKTEDVGVVIDANHMCVASRGVGDTNSKTGTAYFSGKFKDENIKREFLNYINSK